MPPTLQVEAAVTDSRRVAPGLTLLRLHAAELAKRAQPGQFLLARCSHGSDPLLRRPFPFFAIDAPYIEVLVRSEEPGRRWLAQRSPGQTVDLLGPLGHGFALAPSTRRLLLVAEGMGLACLAALAGQALRAGLEVTLLGGFAAVAGVLPADLLPPEVEYRVATADGSLGQRGTVADLLPAVIQWADQVCAAGSPALYRSLAAAVARYRLLLAPDFAQIWLLGPVACGTGACLSCTVQTRRGAVASCREGPVFNLREVEIP